MDERVERTVDSFFGDDDHVITPRGDIDTARSVGSNVSSVSSSASSSVVSVSSQSQASSTYSSPAQTPREDSEHSAPSTARSSSSDDTSLSEPEKAIPDTERTNKTYESNDFEPETPHDPPTEKIIESDEEVQIEPVVKVDEIGAGDANILTVNIPSGKTPREVVEQDEDSDFTDVSPMITPRPDPVEHKNDIEIVTHSVPQVKVNATASRPKSAHPNKSRIRKTSNASSVASKNSVNSSLSDYSHGAKHQDQIEKHRERLLYNTSKSSKV
jgi:hypothetical protein